MNAMTGPTDLQSLDPRERRDLLKRLAGLSNDEVDTLFSGSLSVESADTMIENVIGVMRIPMGLATGFLVNGREHVIPMVTEERSVITMAMRGAEFTRSTGGFKAAVTGSTMIGQIQIMHVNDFEGARKRVLVHKDEILELANTLSKSRRATDVEIRPLETSVGRMVIVELMVDVRDTMGANVVDSMCEAVAPMVEGLTGGEVKMKILSNLATKRVAHVETSVNPKLIGEEIAKGILEASAFADADPYRATTHNKGIMNGVAAILLATSNDTRAVEAGAHAFAAITGRYKPLSTWRMDEGGNLRGELSMPMPVGVLGGSISTHPIARIALKVLNVKTAVELGEVVASVGLASNLGALNVLVTEGRSSIGY